MPCLSKKMLNYIRKFKKLKANLATTNDNMSQLQRQLEQSKAELEQEEQDKVKQAKRLKKQLDQYIAHIDECINWPRAKLKVI